MFSVSNQSTTLQLTQGASFSVAIRTADSDVSRGSIAMASQSSEFRCESPAIVPSDNISWFAFCITNREVKRLRVHMQPHQN